MSVNINKETIPKNGDGKLPNDENIQECQDSQNSEIVQEEFEISYGSSGYSYTRNRQPFPYPIEGLATMWQRLVAYFFDSVFFAILGSLVFVSCSFLMRSDSISPSASHDFMWAFMGFDGSSILSQLISSVWMVAIFLCVNFFSTFFVFATNGFTPGKWLMGIRIVTLSGEKITFWEAFLREALMKSLFNSLTSGLLNFISFVWGCFNAEHKTIHDLASKTTVVRKNLLS